MRLETPCPCAEMRLPSPKVWNPQAEQFESGLAVPTGHNSRAVELSIGKIEELLENAKDKFEVAKE